MLQASLEVHQRMLGATHPDTLAAAQSLESLQSGMRAAPPASTQPAAPLAVARADPAMLAAGTVASAISIPASLEAAEPPRLALRFDARPPTSDSPPSSAKSSSRELETSPSADAVLHRSKDAAARRHPAEPMYTAAPSASPSVRASARLSSFADAAALAADVRPVAGGDPAGRAQRRLSANMGPAVVHTASSAQRQLPKVGDTQNSRTPGTGRLSSGRRLPP